MTGRPGQARSTLCETLSRRLKPVLPALTVLDGDAVRDVFGVDHDPLAHDGHLQSLAEMLDRQDLVVLVAADVAPSAGREGFDDFAFVHLADGKATSTPRDADLTIDTAAGLSADETADLVIAAIPVLSEAAHIADILERHARLSA
jgi:hypothetical protein